MTNPLPPVERVRPGLWTIPVPLPNNSLRYVLVYAFETPQGPYLIDAGWNTDDAYAALETGMKEHGSHPTEIQKLLISHVHPDHYGMSGRLKQLSSCEVVIHEKDAEVIKDTGRQLANLTKRSLEKRRSSSLIFKRLSLHSQNIMR